MGTWGTGLFSSDMARDILEQLRETDNAPVDVIHASSGENRFAAFIAFDKIGWKEAGFEKVAAIAPRPGDDQTNFPSYGVAWSALAHKFRQGTS